MLTSRLPNRPRCEQSAIRGRARLGLVALAVATVCLGGWSLASAATPPSSSPAARHEHPRVLFTAADLEGIRTRIATYYRSEFQDFIDLVGNPVLSGQLATLEAPWGAFNNAFLAVLGTAEMQGRGFRYGASKDTPAEYCSAAMGYARQLLPRIAAAAQQPNEVLHEGYPEPYYFPVLATYDWCYAYLSTADRQAIVDAYVAAYNTKYLGQNALTMTINSMKMLANNRGANALEDIMGIVAFWGDPYPSASLQQDLYDTFHTVWYDRQFLELQRYYANGTGWHEASGGYFKVSFTSLALAAAFLQSALNDSPTTSLAFFSGFAPWIYGNIKPHSLATSGCTTGRCPVYLERWGMMTGGIDGFSCKNSLLNSGLLRVGRHGNAGLTKYLTQSVATDFDDCTTVVTKYGGPWTNAVLFWFVFGDRDIAAKSPAAAGLSKNQKLGLGEYTMKSGYGPTDSQVIFWAPQFRMYGHATHEIGHFTIHKFGDLLLTSANSKSGDAVLSNGAGRNNVFRNVVGIRKSADDHVLSFDGRVNDPLFEARGLSDVNLAGSVTAEHLANDAAYVRYDGSLSWSPSTATHWQRSLVRVYGPPDHEYVVVMDRVNATNPNATKVWKAWVPVQPQYLNGTPTQPRLGKWTSSTSSLLSVTNAQGGLKSQSFESAPTHGRLFMQVHAPTAVHINLQGGPGKEFQSGVDDGSTPWGAPAMTDAMRAHLGWGRIEVVPQTAQSYDAFLVAFQFGDSNSLASMTPTRRLTSGDSQMIGVHVTDPLAQWVTMFAQHPSTVGALRSTTYAFQSSTAISHHLVTDLAPNQPLYVSVSVSAGTTTITVTPDSQPGAPAIPTSPDGVLRFSVDSARVLGPPASPTNVRIGVR